MISVRLDLRTTDKGGLLVSDTHILTSLPCGFNFRSGSVWIYKGEVFRLSWESSVALTQLLENALMDSYVSGASLYLLFTWKSQYDKNFHTKYNKFLNYYKVVQLEHSLTF